MSDQPEALRLADLLEMGALWQYQEKAAAELRRQHDEIERLRGEVQGLRQANARYRIELGIVESILDAEGEYDSSPTDMEYWHDLHDRVQKLKAERDALLKALKAIVKSLADQDDEGLIEHSQQMIDARAAIDAARSEK